MSNLNSSRQAIKVIGLKKIEKRKEPSIPFSASDDNGESTKQTILQEIAMLKAEYEQLLEEKAQLMEQTKKEIAHEKKTWESEKESLKTKAFEEGYEEGFALGKQEAQEQYATYIQEGNDIVQYAKNEFIRTVEKHKLVVATLAIKTAEKILTKKIEEEPDHFIHIVKTAIEQLKEKPVIEIILHPDDYRLVIEQLDELEEVVGIETSIIVQMDDTLVKGDCILKHPNGQIELGIDLQLRQIKNALAEKIMESL